MITLGLELSDSNDDIKKEILKGIRDELNSVLPRTLQRIKQTIRKNTIDFFMTSKEALALNDGILSEDFGFYAGTEADIVKKIVYILANSVEVDFNRIKLNGLNLTGGITVYAIIDDFSDILSLPEAEVETLNGENLPWLKWLLLDGDRIIIQDYQVVYGPFEKYGSRSGDALMFKAQGKTWRVPPEYAGTSDNNWITRVIFDTSEAYINMISEVIEIEIDRIL